METQDNNHNRFSDEYNQLGDVQTVASEVDARNILEEILNELSEMDDPRFGLWLLHRHHLLEPGEFLLEMPTIYHGQPALSSAAAEKLPTESVPYRWSLAASGEWLPMEYTTDAAVREAFSEPRLPAVMNTVARTLKKYQADDLLGFCVLTRAEVLADDSNARLEINEGARSIVTLRATAGMAEESALPTTWCLSGDQVDSCRVWCQMRDWCRRTNIDHVRIPDHRSVHR